MPAVYSKICTADKTRIFQAYTCGEDYIQPARQIGIKRTTAYLIVRRELDHDSVVALPRDGLRSVKMSEEILETVIAIVSDHTDYMLMIRLPDAPHVTS
ncbi:hypothetical protein ElyMa_006117500 [Elysia marginata]|uniref:Transposase n=1 Tax=Elysia marginata TaxID=1093978 RepID=A0AAV4GUE7_9GAST|nr:hypothetical protein ElyMa_006117500 [Elysia marginata]